MKKSLKKYILAVFTLLICMKFSDIYCQNPESLNRRGVEAGEEENYEEARENFDRAAEDYNKTTARILHNQGMVYEKQGNITQAIESYQEAVRRNPEQYQSLERLGYLKYKQGKYSEAVELGEKALSLDPDNEKVRLWIEAAYSKKIESIQKAEQPVTEDKEKYYTTEGDHFPPRYDPLDIYRTTLLVTFDFSLLFRYQGEESRISYEWSPGQVMNFPYTVTGMYRPYKKWAFFCIIEHPYTGAALPNVSSQSERIEAWYYAGNFVFGGGLLLHHYKDRIFNFEELSMMDLKAGGSIHYESGETVIDALLYPRLLIPDGSWNKNLTYDIAYNELKYGFRYSPSLLYYTRFTQADFYFFNHDENFSDYYGYFDLALGGNIVNHTLLDTIDLTFSGELGRRFNLQRKGVDNPYGIANGQGLLGIDIMQEGGSFFSGQKSSSTLLKLGIKERFTPRFFAYQNFYADMAGYGSQYQDYLFQFGIGYIQ